MLGVAEANGLDVRTVRPLMTNSDHANFAQAGIPALRLVAGFDDPPPICAVVLTPADTRDKVGQGELRTATLFTAALVAAACNADPAERREGGARPLDQWTRAVRKTTGALAGSSTSRSRPISTRRLAPAKPRSSSSSVKRSPTRWKT